MGRNAQRRRAAKSAGRVTAAANLVDAAASTEAAARVEAAAQAGPLGWAEALARLAVAMQAQKAARAKFEEVVAQVMGSRCPGTLELHADGSAGECDRDDECVGGLHPYTESCGHGEYGCEDCGIELDDDEDPDAEPSPAPVEAMAQFEANWARFAQSRPGSDG